MKSLYLSVMVVMLSVTTWAQPGDQGRTRGSLYSPIANSISFPAGDEVQSFDTIQRSESFKVEPGGRLDLNCPIGAVNISTWKKNEAVVKVEGIPAEHENFLLVSYDGGMLRVEYSPNAVVWSRRIRFNIELPGSFDLDIRTGGGEIEVLGDLAGTMRAYTEGGDITTGDIEGQADLTTDGGNVRVGTITDVGYIMSSGGDIRIEGATTDLDVHTAGGDIRAGKVGGALKAHTAGGGISIEYVGGNARVSTSGGDIELDEIAGDAHIVTNGGDVEVGKAKGFVRARTAGGNIELTNVTGSVDAKTGGGDVFSGLVPQGSRPSSLVTAGGDIVLYVDSTARTTIEARIRPKGDQHLTYVIKPVFSGGDKATVRVLPLPVKVEPRGNEPPGHNLQITATIQDPMEYEIRSNFEAKRYEENKDKSEVSATYVLNGGGSRIWLETANGNIDIRQRKPR